MSKNKKVDIFKIVLLTFLFSATQNSQTFVQNFNSSTTLSTYYNASPTTHQFDDINTSGAGVTVNVNNNDLRFIRASTHTGYFVRATDLSPSPTGIIYKFDVSVTGNSSAQTDAATLYIGSSFAINATTPVSNNIYCQLGISFTTTDGTFSMTCNNMSSGNLTGTQTIRWVLNNTGATLNYTSPSGNTVSLANDKADMWANTTLLFDEEPVHTTTQTMTDFKFIFAIGTGTIIIDNIEAGFSNDNNALPVELKNFSARSQNNNVILNWKTVTETNNSGFEVERSTRHALQTSLNRNWEKVGFVRGSGTSSLEREYNYSDNNLRNGKYSYRLKQIDLDGTTEYSQVKEVEVGSKNRRLRTNPNPFNSTTIIKFEVEEKTEVSIKLYDLLGRVVAEIVNNELKEVGEHEVKFNANHLTSGVYLIKMLTNKHQLNEKLVLIK